MKKIIITLLILVSAGNISFSQNIIPLNDPDAIFALAKEQFDNKEYSASFRNIETWLNNKKKDNKSENKKEEAMYLHGASAWYSGNSESSILLSRFLKEYPNSSFASKACFLLGSSAMDAGLYKEAVELFSTCNKETLSKEDYMTLNLYHGYVYMKSGKFDMAKKSFAKITDKTSRYVAALTYFDGWMKYCDKNTDRAMDDFDKLRNHPQYKDIIPYYDVQIQYYKGNYKEAIDSTKKLLAKSTIDYQKQELYRLLGSIYFDMGSTIVSQEYYNKYVKTNPASYLKGDNYRIGLNSYKLSDYSTAINFLSKIANNDDAIGQSATYHLGLCYLSTGSDENAKMSFAQASLSDYDIKTKEKALYNYALLCYKSSFSSFNEQVKAFIRVITEFPDSEFSNEIYGYLSEIFLSSNNYEESLTYIDKIENPDIELIHTKAKMLFFTGVKKFNTGNMAEALNYFNRSIELAKNTGAQTTEVYFWKGETLYNLNNDDEAQTAYKQFLNSRGADTLRCYPSALYSFGYILFNKGIYNEAINKFTGFISLKDAKKDIRYADALNRLGDCFYALKNYDEAVSYYDKADISSANGNGYAVYKKAYTLGLEKKYLDKISILNSFKARFPESEFNDDVLFEKGLALSSVNEKEKAISAFSELMDKYPQSELAGKAGIQIALIYFNDGKTDNAVKAYKKVIETYPGSSESKVALSDLKMIYVNDNKVNDYISYTKELTTPVRIDYEEQDSLSFAAAEHLLVTNKSDEAIASLENYLSSYPKGAFYVDACYHLGRLYNVKDEQEKAAKYLRNVLNSGNNEYKRESINILSELSYNAEDFENALKYYRMKENHSDNASEKIISKVYEVRCLYKLKRYAELIPEATNAVNNPIIPENDKKEITYYRAKALILLNKQDKASTDLKYLSSYPESIYGAEASYLLAKYYFDKENNSMCNKTIRKFMESGTPHSYWLAKSFILLSDMFVKEGDSFQAKQYLLSLKENYKEADDEITDEIAKRLKTINEKENN